MCLVRTIFLPTPGKCITHGIFNAASSVQFPMPDTIRSWGDCKAPAERMISFLAVRLKVTDGVPYVPAVMAEIPVAVIPSNKIFAASVFLYMIGAWWLSRADCKNDASEDERYPVLGSIVSAAYAEPRSRPLLKPGICGIPASGSACRHHVPNGSTAFEKDTWSGPPLGWNALKS